MRSFLLFLGLFGVIGAFFVPPQDMEKCDLGDSLGIIICIAPVTSLFSVNPANFTRARGIRMVEECRNATICISRYPCASKVRLDKMFGVCREEYGI